MHRNGFLLRPSRRLVYAALLLVLGLVALVPLHAQAPNANTNGSSLGPITFNVGVGNGSQRQNADAALQILFTMTVLALAPSIVLLMTSFTRIVVVLSFLRNALGVQGAPANQILIGLSLFMTLFIMAPAWDNIHRDAIVPYKAQQISGEEALDRASIHMRNFMLRQARPKDVELFAAMADLTAVRAAELPLRVVIPGFVISELRTAFQMGFLLFIPFLLIDLVVATVLMSMGMMMMPPMSISLPLKILLFVLVDGWGLIVRSLVQSFSY